MGCCGQGAGTSIAQPKAATTLANERLAICYRCPQIQFHMGMPWCGTPVIGALTNPETCGCLLTWKVKMKAQRCPLDKWPSGNSGDH